MESESEEKKEMLIIDGNAFYEIDLECVKKKKQCAQTVHPEKKTDRINSRNMKDKDNIRQHDNNPAVVTVATSAAAIAASAVIVSAQAQKDDDPEDITAGIISA